LSGNLLPLQKYFVIGKVLFHKVYLVMYQGSASTEIQGKAFGNPEIEIAVQ
jgi:hypothetical protein